ncbi:uncharacterized protein LOC144209663 [Stigmatopora nigra]
MSSKKTPSKFDKKDTASSHQNEPQKQVVICNRGHLYNIRVPRAERREETLSLSASEYDKIIARARTPSFLEREEALEKASQKNKEAAEERKRQIIEKDRRTAKCDVETESLSRRQRYERYMHMRCKAQMEQDNQIRKLDTSIARCKIQAERDTQSEWKKHCDAVGISKDKADFERVVKAQQEMLVKQEKRERKRKEEGRRYLDNLAEQIKQNEHVAAVNRQEWLGMGKKETEEDKLQNQCIEEVKEEKLSNFRATGISDKYYLFVKKKADESGKKVEKFQYHGK